MLTIFVNCFHIIHTMIQYIKIRRGLDIPIKGEADLRIAKRIVPKTITVKPTDFRNVIPKLLVRVDDIVKAGSPIFCDKNRPDILFTSPHSGKVTEIVRGEKRKILEIRIETDPENEYLSFDTPAMEQLTREDVITLLLKSGLWPSIIQRPYGIVADPDKTPRDIFISGFYSAPLSPDMDFILKDELEDLQAGIDVMSKLTKGNINISLLAKTHASTLVHKLKGVEYHIFDGPHPAGNVGVQINAISPINKGDIVWTIDPHLLSIIGRFFRNKIVDMSKRVAITGPKAIDPAYIIALPGIDMNNISEFTDRGNPEDVIRFVSGNVLTGINVGEDGSLGFYHNHITLLKEGLEAEMLGWAKPFRPKRFSVSRAYFSWLTPKKSYKLDTNLNGGERAFVMNDVYDKVFPMSILPVYLLKAILAKDIDRMEQLGIYEVIEEDFALCEFVCPSKIEIQNIISQAIELMIKEMA